MDSLAQYRGTTQSDSLKDEIKGEGESKSGRLYYMDDWNQLYFGTRYNGNIVIQSIMGTQRVVLGQAQIKSAVIHSLTQWQGAFKIHLGSLSVVGQQPLRKQPIHPSLSN